MRYFLGLLGIVALILGVLLLIIRGFSGDEPKEQKFLTDYTTTNTTMQMTIQGPVNAEQQHQGVRVTIGKSENRVEILQGYDQKVVSTQSFTSNETAYGTFLRALQLKGYTKGKADPKLADERGFCPAGNRFIFEIKNGDNKIQRFWQSSCKEGNFGGNLSAVMDLFEAQIPEYRTIISDVEL